MQFAWYAYHDTSRPELYGPTPFDDLEMQKGFLNLFYSIYFYLAVLSWLNIVGGELFIIIMSIVIWVHSVSMNNMVNYVEKLLSEAPTIEEHTRT